MWSASLLLFPTIGAAFGAGLPSFEWVDDHSDALPLLKITFPDGKEDDFAVLNHFDIIPVGRNEDPATKDNCIYDGYLTNEKDVYVTLTGGCVNSNSYEVQFRSRRLSGFMFKVRDGEVEEVKPLLGTKSTSRDATVVKYYSDKVVKKAISQPVRQRPLERALNPAGYYLRVKAIYDDNFKEKFGADVVNAARRVLAQAQSLYKLRDSLTTEINFKVDPEVDYVPGRWVASTDLDKVAKYSVKPNIDAFVYLAFRNNEAGTAGIAYHRTTCGNPDGRTSLNEYLENDLISGQTVAHEIGHNLGMDHDFIGTPENPRFDSKKNPCSKIGGIMDYHGIAKLWSTCSVEDFTSYVNSVNPFCLEVIA